MAKATSKKVCDTARSRTAIMGRILVIWNAGGLQIELWHKAIGEFLKRIAFGQFMHFYRVKIAPKV